MDFACLHVRGWLLALAGSPMLLAAPAAADHQADPGALGAVPRDRPAAGMVHEGLAPARPGGPCAGSYQLSAGATGQCTHGPDPAPAGVDVRDPRSLGELAAAGEEGGEGEGGGAGAEQQIPCTGTGTDGKRVLAIYARASNVPNRYAEIAPLIREWAAAASGVFDASAEAVAESRRVRFVTAPEPGCELVVQEVTLSPSGDDSFTNTVSQLRSQGYDSYDRKYLVWMDATVICGQAQVRNDDSASQSNSSNGKPGVSGMIARVDSGCWGRLGERESVEAHELVHTFGGVQHSAPNASGGWHCVDESDTVCYSDWPNFPTMLSVCPPSFEQLLDCNGDDYFNPEPPPAGYLGTHWNVADSAFLVGDGTPLPPPEPEPEPEQAPAPAPAGATTPVYAAAPEAAPARRCKPKRRLKRGKCVKRSPKRR